VNRYTIGLLFDPSTQTIANLKPVNYVSFASPHLGTRNGVTWFTENVMSRLPFISKTTDQFFLRDAAENWRKTQYQIATTKEEITGPSALSPSPSSSSSPRHIPLLFEMALEGSVWYKAFALFQQRLIYTNVEKDHRVNYNTGAIWPFKMEGEVWKKPYKYMEKYPNVVSHPSEDFTWTVATGRERERAQRERETRV
jgi:hypothetical protein